MSTGQTAHPRRIVGFHQDDCGDWVADLECGHAQHVRHDPPWQNRPWVVTDAGRRARLGETLECVPCGDSAVAHTDDAPIPEGVVPVEMLKRILDAFNAHDLDAIMQFFAEDCSLDMPRGPEPWGTRYEGKPAVREALATRFQGLPDVRYSEDRHWVCADRGVSEWLLTGTTRQGARIRVRGCDHWQFRDGRVIRKDSYWKIVDEAPPGADRR